MFRFGMPTLLETAAIADCAALCRELGLSFIEMNMNLPQYQVQEIDAARFRAVARAYGVAYTIHLDENMNMADFNPLVAGAYRQTALDTIALAKELEIPVLNMHMPVGVYFTLPEKKAYLFEAYPQRFLDAMARFRDACTQAIGGSGIQICVENWHGYTPWQIRGLDLFLESPAFGLTYDVGHNRCVDGMDEPVILARKARLRHMHLHDVLDGKKDHQALGTGDVDILGYLALAKEVQASVVLETKTVKGLRASVDWLRVQGELD